jgi:hypothetical protein
MVPGKKLHPLFIILFVVLLLPALQRQFNVVDSGRLYGVSDPVDSVKMALSLRSWFNGSFQQSRNDMVQHTIGFRQDFIRLSNQVNYSLLRNTPTQVVIGKHGNIFDPAYIDAYYGKDYLGEDKIREAVLRLKFIQDTLDKLGKKFVVIYAPNKARFMSEDIPEQKVMRPGGPSNYLTYLRLGDSVGLHQIDFNGWFISLRGKTKHLIMSKAGMHWTAYGGLIALDSFRSYMKASGYRNLPDIVWDENEANVTGNPLFDEDDISKVLNLIAPISDEQFFHPNVVIKNDTFKVKPKAIYIADSYLWQWWMPEYIQKISPEIQFWHYYRDLFSLQKPVGYVKRDLDPMQEMLNADWIVMMYTEFNLKLFAEGFPEEAYNYFKGIKHTGK